MFPARTEIPRSAFWSNPGSQKYPSRPYWREKKGKATIFSVETVISLINLRSRECMYLIGTLISRFWQECSLSGTVFSTKVLIGDTIFYGRRDRHFTWLSEPREGPTACGAKGVPSFLSDFKTLRIGIEPATSPSAVKRSTDWANPAARKYFPGCDFNTQIWKEALKSRFKRSQLDFSFQSSDLLKISR